jgi:hypothetical protein
LANRYVNVTISRETQAVAQKGFGIPLILATEKAAAYKEYTELAAIGTDFTEASNTYKVAQAIFAQTPKVEKLAILGVAFTEGTTATTALTDALNTLRLANDDWYYLVSPAHADATITALSSWANANGKFYFASTSNKTLGTTLNGERTVLLVHPTPGSFPAEAWVGMGAPRDVGSFTWTFKTLNGIAASGYTATDINSIEAAKGSTYIKEGGVNITSKGITTSGEYIDIIQGQDYITARMTENVFGSLVNTDKVPYTPQGIAMIVAEMEKTFKDAHDMGIIAEDANGKPLYSVSVPNINDISSTDKANRLLPDIDWSATIAGAVEDADINGVLTL